MLDNLNIITKEDYLNRRKSLVSKIKNNFDNLNKNNKKINLDNSVILLFNNLEHESHKFTLDKSFYYLTGISEPASVSSISLKDNSSELFIPNTNNTREVWVDNAVTTNDKLVLKDYDLNKINYLGEPIRGFEFSPFFEKDSYSNLIKYLENIIKNSGAIFTISNIDNNLKLNNYFEPIYLLNKLINFLPELKDNLINISQEVADLRVIKNKNEIGLMYQAIDITNAAHEAAAKLIKPGVGENEVQAAIEYIFTESNSKLAFPSIVGSGRNSTVLHYTANNKVIAKDELVVVDIGASFGEYAADLTRTYPSNGKFTERQKEIYNIVLDTQAYIADLAKPGLWLNNPEHPDKSLNHLTKAYLKAKKLDKYLPHGIGHYLGLDVHDVGDYKQKLAPGMVITIEPGIYIPEEQLGVRIEDDYWITDNGAICLSEELPKTVKEIEAFMLEDL